MANTGAYLAAGLLAGVSRGAVDYFIEEARGRRDVMLREMDQRFRREEAEENRGFTAEQNRLGREHASSEADKTRKHSAGLLSNSERFTDDKSLMWIRRRDTEGNDVVQPVRDTDGQQMKGRTPNENRYQAFAGERDGKKGLIVFDRVTGEEEFREGATITPRPPGGGSRGDTARMREAQWLVDKGIYRTIDEAYASLRSGVSMSPQAVRAKALSWISSQKDDVGQPRYKTPEDQAAALEAYELFVAGNREEALAKFKSINPKSVADEAGFFTSLWRSMSGAATGATPAPAPTPAKPATPAPATPAPGAAPASAPEPGGSAGKPAGAGTTQNPYKATGQSDIDWFRQHAPAGAVIEVVIDGKPKRFTK